MSIGVLYRFKYRLVEKSVLKSTCAVGEILYIAHVEVIAWRIARCNVVNAAFQHLEKNKGNRTLHV